ncbi:MAG: EAL domain-containing protein [Methylobacter sp.]
MIKQAIEFTADNGSASYGSGIDWTPELIWSYAVSDALIMPIYYFFSFSLIYFIWCRKSLKFRWAYLILGAFMLGWGTVHLRSLVLLWQLPNVPNANTKFITALALIVIATSIYLVRIISQAHSALHEKDGKLCTLGEQFDALMGATSDAIIFKDGEGRLVVANEAAKRLFKLHDIDWQGKTSRELDAIKPELRGLCEKCLEAEYDPPGSDVYRIEDEAGNHWQFSVRKMPLREEIGGDNGLIFIGRDATDLWLAEQELRIAAIAIESQEGVVVTDVNNRILRVNSAFTRLTGYSAEEVVGKTPAILKSGRHDQSFYQAMWQKLVLEKRWQGEVWDRRKNGEIYPKWLTISAVADSAGRVSHYVGAFTDLSGHKEAEAAIHRLAFYDPLTDLPNRRLLNDRLEVAMSVNARSQHYAAIMMIDLDNFKAINDTQGHETGDRLLAEVAKRLKACVRQGDTVARLGGDEFVVMLENLDRDEAIAAAQAQAVGEKILKAINQSYSLGGNKHYSSASVGIGLFVGRDPSSTEILKRADAAMYQAKNAGRNALRFFDPEMQASLEARMVLELELHSALAQHQFQLYYQIQVDDSGHAIGAEALLRWHHPRQGLISPDQFIPLAEESGLILPIGDWVLRAACLQLKEWSNDPVTKDLHLAVNVSARQFSQSGFVSQVCSILAQTGANATRLKLELTESLLMHNIDETIEKMETLKQLGIRFSMDDFGTGYSSLSYLKNLPITQLKIDQFFIRDIITDPNDAAIVKTIIGMAGNLGLNVIAEGVETEEQRACLERQGCLAYQGYLFSKPVPLDEFESLLSLVWTQARSIQNVLKSIRS